MKRIIIDLDAGTDDAHALLLFLFEHKRGNVLLEAITCCQGNTSVDNVVVNVMRLLEATRQTQIPVYKGPPDALIHQEPDTRFASVLKFHGEDGFADLDHDSTPDLSLVRQENAVLAMNRIISNNPGQISLVCIGPLTNVALALKVFPEFKNQVKDLSIMGGNYTGVGNTTSSAEYNFHCDPEAASIVLDCIKCPILIMPIEACRISAPTLDWRFDVLSKVNNDYMKLLNRAESKIWARYDTKKWNPCDAFLAAAYLYPEKLIVRKSSHNVGVELAGYKTRGQAVLDHTKSKTPNATIIEEIDVDKFKAAILEACEGI